MPHLLGSDCRVIPSLPLRRRPGCKRCRARPGLAYLPHRPRVAFRVLPHIRRIPRALDSLDQRESLPLRRLGIVCAELHEQQSVSLGQKAQIWRAFPRESFREAPFEAFQPDGAKLQQLGYMIRGRKNVRVTEPDQRPVLWAVNQLQLCFQNDRASSFRSDQRSRNVETALRQQLIEVVTRNAPRNFRKSRPDQSRVLLLDALQLTVNLSATTTLTDHAFQFYFACGSHRHH